VQVQVQVLVQVLVQVQVQVQVQVLAHSPCAHLPGMRLRAVQVVLQQRSLR
jgi:hypothetical protein